MTEHVNNATSLCFGVLAVLRKIKNMTPQETKKSLVQSLIILLSKLNFNDVVTIDFSPEKDALRTECSSQLCIESLLLRKRCF